MVIDTSALIAILFAEEEAPRLVQAIAAAETRVVGAPTLVEAAAASRSAYQPFGKGVGSPGVLNYGDCLAYGIAAAERDALLFKGDDFSRTDVVAARY